MAKILKINLFLSIILISSLNLIAKDGDNNESSYEDILNDWLKNKADHIVDKTQPVQVKQVVEQVEEKKYRSPYFNIPTEKIPGFELFFGDRVPNQVLNLIDQLDVHRNKFETIDMVHKQRIGLLLYGPPGTGKSTVAELIARKAGRKVIYINGGEFTTEWQASGAKATGELFQAARNLGEPCVIIIDEVDGAAAKVRANANSSEQRQTVLKLLGELNNNILSKDSDIYVICTTNHMDQMESPIVDRFDKIKLDLPDYNLRKKIILHYLKSNNLNLTEKNSEAYFSPEFLRVLTTATKNWGGRQLKAIINKAISEHKNPRLTPEHESLWRFRIWNKYDFENRPLSSVGDVAGAPVYTAIELLKNKKDSRLEKMIYSKYIEELKTIKDAQSEDEKKLMDHEKPFIKQFGKQMAVHIPTTIVSAIISGTLGVVIQQWTTKNLHKLQWLS